jgi:hypothetical protein
MRVVAVLSCLFIALLVLFITTWLNESVDKVFSSSPPFPTRTIFGFRNQPESGVSGSPADIKSVAYFSDGQHLNATLWLASPLCLKHVHCERLRYGMRIFVSNIKYPDYDVSIQEQTNKTFKESLFAYEPTDPKSNSPNSAQNITLEDHAYTPVNGSRYLNLSLDLKAIGSPDKYYIYFYTANQADHFKYTYSYRIPPQRNIVLFKWPANNITTNDTQPATVRITSIDLASNTTVKLNQSTPAKPGSNEITIKFNPDNLSLPINGNVTTQAIITVPKLLHSAPYPQTLNVTEYFSTFQKSVNTEHDSFKIIVVQPNPLLALQQSIYKQLFVINLIIIAVAVVIALILPGAWSRKAKPSGWATGLKVTDVLQIDATIIAGVLILLTLTTTAHNTINLLGTFIGSKIPFGAFTAEIILPFAASAMITLIYDSNRKNAAGHIQEGSNEQKHGTTQKIVPEYGTRVLIAGFGALMVIITITIMIASLT